MVVHGAWEYPTNCYRCFVDLIREDDGGYSVICPHLPGAGSQGDTVEEALANITEVLAGLLEVYRVDGFIPWLHPVPERVPFTERRVVVVQL